MKRFAQHGFNLVELMTALALTMVVLAAINQMFFNTRMISQNEEEFTAIQDNARFVINKLSQEVRMAGYVGSTRLGSFPSNYTSAINNFIPFYHNFDIAIEGYHTSQALPSQLPSNIRPGTDILIVRRVDTKGFRMLRQKTDTSLAIEFVSEQQNGCPGGADDKINGLCPGDIVILSDFEKAKSFVITSITTIFNADGDKEVIVNHAGADNSPTTWGGPSSEIALDKFDPQSARLSRAATTVYFIDNDTTNPLGFALRRKVNQEDSQVVIQGVEEMHILYGVDTDGDGSVDRYLASNSNLLSADPQSNQPLHFRNVVSIRLGLILRSNNPVTTLKEQQADSQPTIDLHLLDRTLTIDITDGFIRHAVDTTVYLRNTRRNEQ